MSARDPALEAIHAAHENLVELKPLRQAVDDYQFRLRDLRFAKSTTHHDVLAEWSAAAVEARARLLAACRAMIQQLDDTIAIVPREPTDKMIDAALSATNGRLNIPGSALTVNREKMRIRWCAMIEQLEEPK